jgi:hypothetical protein
VIRRPIESSRCANRDGTRTGMLMEISERMRLEMGEKTSIGNGMDAGVGTWEAVLRHCLTKTALQQ